MKDIKVGDIVVCIKGNEFIKEGAIGLVISTPFFGIFKARWSADLSHENLSHRNFECHTWSSHSNNVEVIGNID